MMLNSMEDVRGFGIGGTDGRIGKVDDVYFDDSQRARQSSVAFRTWS